MLHTNKLPTQLYKNNVLPPVFAYPPALGFNLDALEAVHFARVWILSSDTLSALNCVEK